MGPVISSVESVISSVEPVVTGEICVVDADSVVLGARPPEHALRTIRAEIESSRIFVSELCIDVRLR